MASEVSDNATMGVGADSADGPGAGNAEVDTNKLYEILEVAKDADQSEIRKVYRNLSRVHHPDKGGDEHTFKEINAAYEILSDPKTRAAYDKDGLQGICEDRLNRSGMDIEDLFNVSFGTSSTPKKTPKQIPEASTNNESENNNEQITVRKMTAKKKNEVCADDVEAVSKFFRALYNEVKAAEEQSDVQPACESDDQANVTDTKLTDESSTEDMSAELELENTTVEMPSRTDESAEEIVENLLETQNPPTDIAKKADSNKRARKLFKIFYSSSVKKRPVANYHQELKNDSADEDDEASENTEYEPYEPPPNTMGPTSSKHASCEVVEEKVMEAILGSVLGDEKKDDKKKAMRKIKRFFFKRMAEAKKKAKYVKCKDMIDDEADEEEAEERFISLAWEEAIASVQSNLATKTSPSNEDDDTLNKDGMSQVSPESKVMTEVAELGKRDDVDLLRENGTNPTNDSRKEGTFSTARESEIKAPNTTTKTEVEIKNKLKPFRPNTSASTLKLGDEEPSNGTAVPFVAEVSNIKAEDTSSFYEVDEGAKGINEISALIYAYEAETQDDEASATATQKEITIEKGNKETLGRDSPHLDRVTELLDIAYGTCSSKRSSKRRASMVLERYKDKEDHLMQLLEDKAARNSADAVKNQETCSDREAEENIGGQENTVNQIRKDFGESNKNKDAYSSPFDFLPKLLEKGAKLSEDFYQDVCNNPFLEKADATEETNAEDVVAGRKSGPTHSIGYSDEVKEFEDTAHNCVSQGKEMASDCIDAKCYCFPLIKDLQLSFDGCVKSDAMMRDACVMAPDTPTTKEESVGSKVKEEKNDIASEEKKMENNNSPAGQWKNQIFSFYTTTLDGVENATTKVGSVVPVTLFNDDKPTEVHSGSAPMGLCDSMCSSAADDIITEDEDILTEEFIEVVIEGKDESTNITTTKTGKYLHKFKKRPSIFRSFAKKSAPPSPSTVVTEEVAASHDF